MRYKQFRHLDVPETWRQYWSKYPEGYTILESLINWVSQVNDMSDNINEWNNYLDDFVKTFDKNLQDTVYNTLKEWQDTGELEVIINEAIDIAFKKEQMFGEITYNYFYDETAGTGYYQTYIPHMDSEGNTIKLQHGFSNDTNSGVAGETPRHFSTRHKASLAINASVFNSETNEIWGVQIKDGEIIQDQNQDRYWTLGIKENGELHVYPPSRTAQQVLDDGAINALTGFYPMIDNYEKVDPSIAHTGHAEAKTARQVIAQTENNNILIITTYGNVNTHNGMNWDDIYRILDNWCDCEIGERIRIAYMLDGGGSTSTVVRGVMINSPSDENGILERKVQDFLYIKKQSSYDNNTNMIMADMGSVRKKISDLEAEVKNLKEFWLTVRLMGAGGGVNGIESWENGERVNKLFLRDERLDYMQYPSGDVVTRIVKGYELNNSGIRTPKGYRGEYYRFVDTVTDVNDIQYSGKYWALGSASNVPHSDNSWAIDAFHINTTTAIHVAYPYNSGGKSYKRRTLPNGTWGEWRDEDGQTP